MRLFSIFLIFLFISVITSTVVVFVFNLLPTQKEQAHSDIISHFSLQNAPKDSIVGQISQFSGDVFWQSRIATQSAQITTAREIEQGENIVTKKSGRVTLQFDHYANIQISPNSELDIIQTLPSNFVFTQIDGTATYTKLANTPLSVVGLNLLIRQQNGTTTITFDKTRQTISVFVTNGSASVAFEDLNKNTNVVLLNNNNEFLFDDSTRTGMLQKITH